MTVGAVCEVGCTGVDRAVALALGSALGGAVLTPGRGMALGGAVLTLARGIALGGAVLTLGLGIALGGPLAAGALGGRTPGGSGRTMVVA